MKVSGFDSVDEFLAWVREHYGEEIGNACKGKLDCEVHETVSPFETVYEALYEREGSDLEAAERLGRLRFTC